MKKKIKLALVVCCFIFGTATAVAAEFQSEKSVLKSLAYPDYMHKHVLERFTEDHQIFSNFEAGQSKGSYQFVRVKPVGGRRNSANLRELLSAPAHELSDTEIMKLSMHEIFPMAETKKVDGQNVIISSMTRESTFHSGGGRNRVVNTEYRLIVPRDEASMLQIEFEDVRPLTAHHKVDPDKRDPEVEATWSQIVKSIKWRR